MAVKPSEVWTTLAHQLDWSEEAVFVSYQMIKDAGGEPRLAAKFDQSSKLPEVLKKHKRFIMPTSKGYLLHKGSAYFSLSPASTVKKLKVEEPDLFTFGPGAAEHMHLRYALRQGVFDDFLETSEPLVEAWSGRRYINSTEYSFGGDTKFPLSNIQIEVDLGLSLNRSEIVLVEGKMADQEDFNTRQLFLPYLDAKSRTSHTKITPMFFEIHETGVYTLRSFAFDGDDMTSIREVKTVRYELEFDRAKSSYLFVMTSNSDIPQADHPDVIVKAVEAVAEGKQTRSLIASALGDFSDRQGDYYAHAARILGLVRNDKDHGWVLTEDGKLFLSKNNPDRVRELCKRIMSLEVSQLFASEGRQAVQERFEENDLGASTAYRRATTVSSWIKWVDNH